MLQLSFFFFNSMVGIKQNCDVETQNSEGGGDVTILSFFLEFRVFILK